MMKVVAMRMKMAVKATPLWKKIVMMIDFGVRKNALLWRMEFEGPLSRFELFVRLF